MRIYLLSVACAGCFFSTTSLSQTPERADSAISVQLGTTGLSVHAVGAVNPQMNARAGINYFSNYDFTTSTRYIDWDLRLKMRTFDLLLDWFPGSSGFRFTTSLVFNRNAIDARGNYAGSEGIVVRGLSFNSFTYQGVNYNLNQVGSLKGKIDFQPISPYLGIGWGNSLNDGKGWGFSTDIGVLFQGAPVSRLRMEDCTLPGRTCEVVSGLLAVENERLNDKLRRFRVYPVLRAGFNYRF